MDSEKYTVALVKIVANEDELLLTDNYEPLEIGTDIYLSCPSMDFELPEATADLSENEGKIKSLKDSFPLLFKIAAGYPYNKVAVTVTEATLDSSFAVTASNVLFDGLLYSSHRGLGTGDIDFLLRNWKYYMDILGGVPCTEHCGVKYFGDNICKKGVASHTAQITDITGDGITVSPAPVGVDFLYTKGYIALNGINIKVRYWESGATLQLSSEAPADWLGQTISIHAGCDRTLKTCREIHDNESNFYGLGISMADYNPQMERA